MSVLKRLFPRVSSMLSDSRGLAAVEMTIVLATLGIAAAGFGYAAGPAIKNYADRLEAVAAEARCLAAVAPTEPLPDCSGA
jgi:Tfp pilus assembly protein PilE